MTFVEILEQELNEIVVRRWRYVSYLVGAVVAVLIAGALMSQQQPVRALLFTDGLDDEQVAAIQTQVHAIGGITLEIEPGAYTSERLHFEGAGFAIARRLQALAVIVNGQANYTSAAYPLALSTTAMLTCLEREWEARIRFYDVRPEEACAVGATSKGHIGDELDTLNQDGEVVRISSSGFLAPAEKTLFVPRVIALLTVFIPFMIAFETFVQRATSGALLVQLAANGGRFGALVATRFVVATLFGLTVLLVLLLVANAFYGIAPKRGLVQLLLVYSWGCGISSALGLTVAMFFGTARQVLAVLAAYFFALITFSGFVWPLGSAAAFVQTGSYFLPLRVALSATEQWMAGGLPPDARAVARGDFELLAFGALGLGALLILWAVFVRSRQRI